MVHVDSIVKNTMKARTLLQEFFTGHGINPLIIIWDGRDSAEFKEASAQEIGTIINTYGSQTCDIEDEESVKEALYQEYLYYCDEAESSIRKETQKVHAFPCEGMRESYIVTWEGRDGFYGCTCGVNSRGIYSESDDVGPFESVEEVLEQFQA